jgi:ribose transport system substrate-binding protein
VTVTDDGATETDAGATASDATPASSELPQVSASIEAGTGTPEPPAGAGETTGPDAAASPEPTPTPPPGIGYIALDGAQWYVADVSRGVRTAAEDSGYDLVECDSGGTREGVLACADQLAQAGVLGFISMQPFPDLAEQVCDSLGNAPAVGIIYDQGPCQASLLGVDQTESGRLAGAALGALAAERWDCDVKAYVELGSGAGDAIGSARMEGYRAGYREQCKLPRQQRTLSDAQFLITAQTGMAEVLEEIGGKPIIAAGVTDPAALGALQAAAEAGRPNHVWVAGQLADPEARQAIACEARYVASVAQFPDRFGARVVPALVEAIEGGTVAPRMEAELRPVTAENVRRLFPDTPACDA